jgi:hypothetical protein
VSGRSAQRFRHKNGGQESMADEELLTVMYISTYRELITKQGKYYAGKFIE